MSSFMDKWAQQSNAGKGMFLLALVLIFAVPLSGFYLFYAPKLVPLYQNLSEQDAAKIVEQLNSEKVEYKLQNNGRDILVNEADANQARLKLVSDGVQLGGGVGFEIFDEMDYGMTDFAQKIHYQRALQGELSRTISSHQAIQYARVHLVLPEAALFAKETKEPKASVTLIIEENETLGPQQVQGIQKLVANSVEGLNPSRVVVSDRNGHVLSIDGADDQFSMASVGSKKQELETTLADKCNALLVQIFGVNKTVVNVDVMLTNAEVKRRTESVLAGADGNTGVLVSKKSSLTKKQNGNSKSKSASQNNLSESEELSYRTGTQIEETTYGAGQIQRLSVSALIPVGVTDTQLADITDLLKSAVGFDAERGDQIAVKRLPLMKKVSEPLDEVFSETNGSNVSAMATNQQTFASVGRLGFIVGGSGLIVAVLALAFAMSANRSRSLSESERAVVLANVKNWLEADETVIEGEKVL
ncbi:MAG: flagellar M-ring protein FliF [Pseudomonadales bacterium]|nr:flagellar M-ring protein FliF [Pseudomonadales bacterium]